MRFSDGGSVIPQEARIVPNHVAIIMDGNRRFALKHGCPVAVGHWRGVDRIREIISCSNELGIKRITLFAFSTENWNRKQEEIRFLLHLLKRFALRETARLIREGVRVSFIGDLSRFPVSIQKLLEHTRRQTAGGKNLDLVLAINYGGRDELRRAAQEIARDVQRGALKADDLTEKHVERYLDTAAWEAPELLIRTSGEHRLSNFLLWQAAYSEIVISPVLWPDFRKEDFVDAINEFNTRNRRYGE